MIRHLAGSVYLVSHGGVGSMELTRKLEIEYPSAKVGPGQRPFRGAFVHAPFPPQHGPKIGIYLYGDLLNAITSQIRRHPDNPKKIKNNENYPDIHSIKQLLDSDDLDPFGIKEQFFNFTRARIDYPIILLKRESLARVYPLVKSYVGVTNGSEWKDRCRSSDWRGHGKAVRDKLLKRYGELSETMRSCPDIMIKYPGKNLNSTDGLSGQSVNELIPLSSLLEPALAALKCTGRVHNCEERTPRIKHAIRLSDGRFCVNIRLDDLGNNGDVINRSLGLTLLFGVANGALDRSSITVIDHPGVVSVESADLMHAGFEDPRAIAFEGRDLIFVNGPSKDGSRAMYQFDTASGQCRAIVVKGLILNASEKNWVPFIYRGRLHLIYSMNPLTVLAETKPSEAVYHIAHSETAERRIRSDFPWGSTPLIPWCPPFFIGFGHSREPWRSVPILLNVETWRLVMGAPLTFPQPEGAKAWRGKSVQFPYDMRLNGGEVLLSVEYEDRYPVECRLDFDDFCKEFSRLAMRIPDVAKYRPKASRFAGILKTIRRASTTNT